MEKTNKASNKQLILQKLKMVSVINLFLRLKIF